MTSPSNFQAEKQLQSIIEGHSYSLICTHTSLAAFFTRRAAARVKQRPPLINVVHGYLFDDQTPLAKRSILLQAEKMTAAHTDLLLTMNRWDFNAAQKYRLGRRIENIPGVGVDFSRFQPFSPEEIFDFRHDLGFLPSDVLLIFAAEFSNRKNQAMLIRALPSLPQNIRLILPGSGSNLPDCRTLAEQLRVADRVLFPGQQPDMARWYAASNIAVSSSRSEGLPFNVMESMYCGLPIVASAVKGHVDLIADEKDGLLYPYDDATAFARQVSRIIETPGFGRKLSDAARQTVQAYGLDQVLPQVMSAYFSALGNHADKSTHAAEDLSL